MRVSLIGLGTLCVTISADLAATPQYVEDSLLLNSATLTAYHNAYMAEQTKAASHPGADPIAVSTELSPAAQASIAAGISATLILFLGAVIGHRIYKGRHESISVLGSSTIGVAAAWVVCHANSTSQSESELEANEIKVDHTSTHSLGYDRDDDAWSLDGLDAGPISLPPSVQQFDPIGSDYNWRSSTRASQWYSVPEPT